MTSSEKVQVLRRASRSDRTASTTAAASRPPDTVPGSQASSEAVPAQASQARASAARQKGARLLKAGIKTGEVSKLVDAKEAEEAAKTGATAAPAEEENLYEF